MPPAIPLRPDPELVKFSERRSFARAVTAMCLGGTSRRGAKRTPRAIPRQSGGLIIWTNE
jgi:hypothetical protein